MAVVGVPLVLLGHVILGGVYWSVCLDGLQSWFRPYFWVLPAIAFATIFMVIPTINTAILSFYNRDPIEFVGFANYK